MEWIRIPDTAYTCLPAKSRLQAATKRLESALPLLAMLAWPSVAVAMHHCNEHGCTMSTCRLYRGCILATATAQVLQEADEAQEVAQRNRAKVVSAGGVAAVDVFPGSDMPLEWLSPMELSLRLKSSALLRLALKGFSATFPPGKLGSSGATIAPPGLIMAALIPTALMVQEGLIKPGSFSGPGVVAWLKASAHDLVGPLALYCQNKGMDPDILQHPENLKLIEMSRHKHHSSLPPPTRLMSYHQISCIQAETTSDADVDTSQPGLHLTHEQKTGLHWLQATINRFWQLIYLGQAKISQRMKKKMSPYPSVQMVAQIECMMLTPTSLCNEEHPHFTYIHRDQERSSEEGKLRCDRVTVQYLIEQGLKDTRLLCDLAALDPARQYMVVLRLPEDLVSLYLVKEQDPSPKGPKSEVAGSRNRDVFLWCILPVVDSKWMPDQMVSTAPVLGCTAKRCCLPSCGLPEQLGVGGEGGYFHCGVKLLTCTGCRRSLYCTPTHQQQHWRHHRTSCTLDSLSGPGVGDQDMMHGSEKPAVRGTAQGHGLHDLATY
ncbi:hypothetical protein CEUSTIGMA_g12082.t1 [Chlamydomonas eustigma]|uniref:MYND-type domain-containing protein n=1 Tax=Chlamydomonas eustigma TaxID=1157962 RepID=A0A250XNJ4_9CHLO|nr:hypothetical protein CEUSTIGMA_g12082.t1 [Chlamydomonas eustigma]|eukprot:GAX84661.1 hypothetical protein CEUSTIGMA_g12082.t1 [Chlamydomonas eustigma]